MEKKKLRRAVFLDRDGTLNKMVYFPEHGIIDSPFLPSQFELLPKVPEGLRLLRKKGFLLILVSNQPGVAKGNMTKKNFDAVDWKLGRLLAASGVRLDAKCYCLHHPQANLPKYRKNCLCRKPKPGLLLQASRKLGINLQRSYMVGDGIVDMNAGKAAGCKTVFIGAFKPELWKHFAVGKKPGIVAKNLLEAARKIK